MDLFSYYVKRSGAILFHAAMAAGYSRPPTITAIIIAGIIQA